MTTINATGDGLSRHMRRMARGLPPMHGPAREILANEGDAGATQFCIDGYTIDGRAVMRLTGNGHGMTGDELRSYMMTMFTSGPDRPDNHGMGARVATLPFNRAGVVWASRRDGEESLIEVATDEHGTFHSVDWEVDGVGLVDVVNPESAYPGIMSVLDGWGATSGTVVLLLGDDETKPTMTQSLYRDFGNYAARRWWKFPGAIETVKCAAPWNGNYGLTTWPLGYLLPTKAEDHGEVDVGGGVTVEWFVLPRGTADTAYGSKAPTQVSVRRGQSSIPWSLAPSGRTTEFQGEVFDMRGHQSDGPRALMDFGIWHHDVAGRVHLCVHVPPSLGIVNEERNMVQTPGGGHLPMAAWGRAFAAKMPPQIAALLDHRDESATGLTDAMLRSLDPEWRRWIEDTSELRVRPEGSATGTSPVVNSRGSRAGSTPNPSAPSSSGTTRAPRTRRLDPSGAHVGDPAPLPDLPIVRYLDEDPEVDGVTRPGPDIYAWMTGNQVFIRRALPVICQAKHRFRHGVADTVHPLVDAAVENAYGIELCAKIVHLRVIARKAATVGWTTAAVEDHLASPMTLAAMLCGMNAIDSAVRASLRSPVLRAA